MEVIEAISILIASKDSKECDEFDVNFSLFPDSPRDIKIKKKFSDLYDFYDYIKMINRYGEIFNFSLRISGKTVYWNSEEGLQEM